MGKIFLSPQQYQNALLFPLGDKNDDPASIVMPNNTFCLRKKSFWNMILSFHPLYAKNDFSTCSHFRNLGNNELVTLEGKPFVGLTQLRDLTLSHNYIQYVPQEAFTGLIHLQYL